MAKKALSAPEIPLCINVLRLLNYRLAPDELILFDWLTVKQISFKYKPFQLLPGACRGRNPYPPYPAGSHH
ncbi:hypothetical protein AALJ87_04855 [Bacteroides uniformis]|uniref:hypothetical protein n=1 Tax=Bacteroides uniformis TaxID=820 RepID=UPI0035128168